MLITKRDWMQKILGIPDPEIGLYTDEELKTLFEKYYIENLSINQSDFEELMGLYERNMAVVFGYLAEHYLEPNYYVSSQQKVVKRRIKTALERLLEEFSDGLSKSMKIADKNARITASEDMDDYSGKAAPVWDHLEDSYEFAQRFIKTQLDNSNWEVHKHLREITKRVVDRAIAENITSKEASKRLRQELMLSKPDFKFTDKMGRKWNDKKYFRMFAKTTVENAYRESYIQQVIQSGGDLVKISSHDAKDRCKKWENKVISLTGATEGYITYQQMMATRDIFHPNCKHILKPY